MSPPQPRHIVIYDIEDRPPWRAAVPLGAQHVVAMLLGNITPPLLITGALGLALSDQGLILQMVLFMAGLATLVQAYPWGPVGGRIPVIMGTSIAFVGAAIAIGRQFGLAAVFGACLVAASVEIALGLSIVSVRRLFPPLVNGIVVMLIGLTLIPVGMDYAAGGAGAADYGAPHHLLLASVAFLVTLVLNQFARGFASYASMLIGVLAAYGLAMAFGQIDLTPVAEAGWVSLPRPLSFGLEFRGTAILVMAFVYVISTMETLGDISGTLAAVGREPTDGELRGGLLADGVMSALAALFSAFPNTSYSQNVGLVNFTGVASRFVTAISGVLLMMLGLLPKVGALFATIPAAVIGGGSLIMFAMIFASGLSIVHRSVSLDRRNLVILAVSIGLGLGVELRPAVLQPLPDGLQTFFASGLITGGLCALGLNLILPGRQPEVENDDRSPTQSADRLSS